MVQVIQQWNSGADENPVFCQPTKQDVSAVPTPH